MRRRLVLASVALFAVLALAGCAHPAGSMRMDRVNDSELVREASRATRGAGLYPAIDRQRTARRVIENGTLTVLAGRPALESDLPYRYDGAYYDLSSEVVDTRPGASTLVRVDYNATTFNGTRVAFEALPPADRRRLEAVLENPPAIRTPGPEAELPLYYPREANSTLLEHAGGSVVVTYQGEADVVDVGRVRRGQLRVIRYEATLVAESTDAYARHLRRTAGFVLSNLSDAEATVVESAIDDGYYPSDTDDRGFAAIVDRFRRHDAVTGGDYSGSWLVRYEGRYYWVELNYGAFVQDETASPETPPVTPH